MSSLCLPLYSFGSSITQTGSSSMLELLETIGNSAHRVYILIIYMLQLRCTHIALTNLKIESPLCLHSVSIVIQVSPRHLFDTGLEFINCTTDILRLAANSLSCNIFDWCILCNRFYEYYSKHLILCIIFNTSFYASLPSYTSCFMHFVLFFSFFSMHIIFCI